jgi:glycosyltransferase involved in cell wall biosynthesis
VRIGLNLLYLIPGEVGGTQTYAERLVEALAVEGSQHDYVLFVNSEGALLPWPSAGNFRVVVGRFPPRSRAARYAHEQLALPRRLREYRIDLVHSLGYMAPLRPPCASVVSIHDAVNVGYPMSAARRALLGFFVGRSARGCDRVITVSEFSRREIARHYGVSEARVTVTHEGPRDLPDAGRITWGELQQRYGLSKPFIVALGGVRAHKNMARLVEAFGALSADIPHELVLIGRLPPDGHVEREIERRQLGDRVILTGYLPDDHIMPLLGNGDAFVFPSWYEGFGLPVLDAQRAGLPVACSSAASLPEVAGEGAEYFDPMSVDDMARAIRACVTQGMARSQMIARGYENTRRFSWTETARKTLRVYEEVAGDGGLKATAPFRTKA